MTIWQAKPKVFTSWPFSEKVYSLFFFENLIIFCLKSEQAIYGSSDVVFFFPQFS